MFIKKIKRDAISFYFSFYFIKHFLKKEWASCFNIAAKIEFLESNISPFISYSLFSLLRKKYDVKDCNISDDYVKAVKTRFKDAGQTSFLENNILVIKPYISENEKGILMIAYSEIINALPFLFDIKKIQRRYHVVLEPSSESPYQPYNAFIPNESLVFVQSVSEREQVIHKKHGFIPVPLTSGDWVNKKNFHFESGVTKIYDFCVVSNLIPVKRYPFLFASLKKYWKGDLRFAIVASSHLGENRGWMENLLHEYGLDGKADIFMEISQTDVNRIYNQSNCSVLCSLREGSPKTPAESMITGTPFIVYKKHIGFPNWKFTYPLVINYTNGQTLVDAIKKSVEIDKADTAMLASNLIGSDNATRILNVEIKKAALEKGESWSIDILEKVNNIHSYYRYPSDVNRCVDDYFFIQSCANENTKYDANAIILKLGK